VIVVDTNVIAYFWLESERTAAAERLLVADSDWAVPPLWRSEFRNVLAQSVRQRRRTLAAAIELAEAADEQLNGREVAVSSAEVLALSDESGCSAYDCEFVALARRLAVPLVTNDQQVLKAFPSIAISLDAYVP
jgi:predicted nucleic acid-binding protein